MTRRLTIALGLGLFLLITGPKWMPGIGIDPQAVINGAFIVGLTVVIVRSLAERFKQF